MSDDKSPPGLRLRHALRGHKATINRSAWSPDGSMLASPSNDGTVRLWSLKKRKPVRTLDGAAQPIHCVAWSPDGKQIAAGSEYNNGNASKRGRLLLWDAEAGVQMKDIVRGGLGGTY